MTANFPVTVEKQRHVPAKTRFQNRIGIDVDLPEANAPGRDQGADGCCHFFAQRAA